MISRRRCAWPGCLSLARRYSDYCTLGWIKHNKRASRNKRASAAPEAT